MCTPSRVIALLLLPTVLAAQQAPPLLPSGLRDTVQRFQVDLDALERRYAIPYSVARRDRLRSYVVEWQGRLDRIPYQSLGVEERIDWQLLRNTIRRQRAALDQEASRANAIRHIAPFVDRLTELLESRRTMETQDPQATAGRLASLASTIDSLGHHLRPVGTGDSSRAARIVALRTVTLLDQLHRAFTAWYAFYAGYDPLFTWWNADPHQRVEAALTSYTTALRTQVIGQRPGEDEPIIGDPIGADAVGAELAFEMIASTPEDLIAIAEREFAWSEAEMKKASQEMGMGDDWKRALEAVKNSYVEPGRQTDLVRDLAHEAIDFVETRNLLTVPALAKEIWRMEMLSPAQQKVSPFFLGGEVIRVSYPTDTMAEEDKLMSLRGNNPYFSRATVHHELIPGHHLQGFMNARYNAHRRVFRTPFWTEGWALYWEMLLWDKGFPQTPEERVGMLFWRMHRSARIIFSLRFHLGTMSPTEAIDFLVDRVGHERANATAEVHRSFNGSYPPLYQIAYMIGGLQFRSLHQDLVDTGRMTDQAFHDTILQGGPIPIEMVRARLLGTVLPKNFNPSWPFDQ